MTREEALKEFIGYTTYDIQPSVEATKMAIEALERKPKTGRWIDDCGGVKCSCCGYRIDDCFYVKTYCTNCGARMESETKVESKVLS